MYEQYLYESNDMKCYCAISMQNVSKSFTYIQIYTQIFYVILYDQKCVINLSYYTKKNDIYINIYT